MAFDSTIYLQGGWSGGGGGNAPCERGHTLLDGFDGLLQFLQEVLVSERQL